MSKADLILDGTYTPTYDEITDYINMPARELWLDMNNFIKETYKASPRITYSKCSAKPGWNVKYQKSGKSLCTLYPEKDGFVALVVILLDMVPLVEAMEEQFAPEVISLVKKAAPFNGTKWLMIQVDKAAVAEDVKRLMLLKQQFGK